MNVKAMLLALILAGPAAAQGFAGLGQDADGFALPARGPFDFPADHGAHPDFRIEWWYLTANLQDAGGTDYGVQWTLFRSALAPPANAGIPVQPEGTGTVTPTGGAGWQTPQVWMGHAAVTTPDAHHVAERLARGGIGQAGVTAQPFAAWIDEWEMTGTAAAGADGLAALRLRAAGSDFSYDLALTATGPIVPQGEAGYSVKSPAGQASRYYSQPFYAVTGTLNLPQGPVAVTGQGWLDREWSSQPLAADQTGWDWLSLHFDTGEKLMGFRLRDAGDGFSSATWIAADGTPAPLPPGAMRLTPLETADVAGRKVPVGWRVELPARALDITTRPVNPQAWMTTLFPYWEGPIRFFGTHVGRGYLEMTGYE